MSILTSSLLPAPIQQTFSMKLLSVPVPYMIHSIPAEQKFMPAHGGRTLRMRRYNPLPTAVVPLGNSGVLPPPVTISAVDIDATIDFYAQYLVVNEQISNLVCYKSSLIDSEARWGNEAQAKAA